MFVHGDVFGAEATWATQRPLADTYRLLLMNRRGFGSSPDVEGEDFEVDATDVVEVLGDGAHLVGHSYGGVVALLAAARHPETVRSLAVFEPPAFALVAERADVQSFIAEVKAILADGPSPQDFLPRFIRAVGGDPSRLPSPLPPPFVKAAAVQQHGRWPWEAEIPVEDLSLSGFPKLVVSGAHSPIFDAVCDVLEARLPARREVLPGAGHSIPTLGDPVNVMLSEFWHAADTSHPSV
ncbi:MAG: alpha/beta hydrolase [Actinomycetota bacterium]|nr:alpha/beta hydrolase [Actinomycetota bacterium]